MRAFWPAAATVRVTGPARRVAPRRGYSRRAMRQSKPPRSRRVTANVPTHRRAVRVPGRAPRRGELGRAGAGCPALAVT